MMVVQQYSSRSAACLVCSISSTQYAMSPYQMADSMLVRQTKCRYKVVLLEGRFMFVLVPIKAA